MTLPYKRNFNKGRGSEQFYNEDLHRIHTALENINYRLDENQGKEPVSNLDGALWFNRHTNELMYWNNISKRWECVFSKKFQITDQITNTIMPSSPLVGQLWLYNGVLMYFDGKDWQPVRALIQDESQWSNAAFEDYIIVSPLSTANTVDSVISEGLDKYRAQGHKVIEKDLPAGEVFYTSVYYEIGNGELEVFLNGISLTKDLRVYEATRRGVKATSADFENISNAFVVDVDLLANDIISWQISRNSTEAQLLEKALDETELDEFKNTHVNTNFILASDAKWTFDSTIGTDVPYPKDEIRIEDALVSEFVIPNINTDRIFIDNTYDDHYEQVNKVCIKYRTKDIYRKTLSAIHMNPGKLTKITKRLIKVDRLNPTLELSAYNTEFYGFRMDRTGGDFLIPSDGNNQDNGDYVAVGDHVILNYNAAQNYDYVLAVTFEFTWVKSDGLVERHSGKEDTTSFYISNLRTPVAIHGDGFMLEEAIYDVDAKQNVIKINENADDIDIDVWAAKKEYGYIRDIDLEGNGIIHMHNKPEIPLVFVGGVLIHPIYGGLQIDLDKGIIIVPNESPVIENMKNQPWCVVDIAGMVDDTGLPYTGNAVKTEDVSVIFNKDTVIDVIDGNTAVIKGELQNSSEADIYDFILSAGTFKMTGFVDIYYDPSKITENDGMLLFVNGLLVCSDDIVRDDTNGIINIDNLEPGAEYVLLKDPNGSLYKHMDMMQAYSIGFLSDSLVYYKGKLLGNENCVATTDTPETLILNGAVHNEIKLFIEDEAADQKVWKIYDAYNYCWNVLGDREKSDAEKITGTYINLLTTVKLNLENYDEDELVIFAYRFANAVSGYYKGGTCAWVEDDEEDGLPIFRTGSDPYSKGMNDLNLYKNGVKLASGEYQELADSNKIKLLIPFELGKDMLAYMVEPIEKGEIKGYEQIILTDENAIQPNIYKLSDLSPDLYPGRITVYINGLRLPNRDWTVLDNRRIMINYSDYKAASSGAGNFPSESRIKDETNVFEVNHKSPDRIMIEIRKDYDRREVTCDYTYEDGHQLFLYEKKIPEEILDCNDEIIFYINGQYTGLTRRGRRDYNINKYAGCIEILDPECISLLTSNPLEPLMNNPAILEAWKKQTGKTEFENKSRHKITLVWR